MAKALQSEEIATKLKSMLLEGKTADTGETVVCLPATEDRDFRRSIHILIKRLPRTLIADTIADPNGSEGKSIRIRLNSKKQKGTKRGRDREEHGVFDTRDNQETWN